MLNLPWEDVILTITSPTFAHGSRIPRNHTADGANLAPPLTFAAMPPNARTLALIVEDPDAPDPASPQRIFTHWIVYNLPSSTKGLPLGLDRTSLPENAQLGRSDFGTSEYRGPAPPVGRHRYIFRLFALDTRLPEQPRLDRAHLLAAMEGHILEEAELMGVYERELTESRPVSPGV